MVYTGLTSKEAKEILSEIGLNRIEEKKGVLAKKMLRWFISPISLMLVVAAILSFVAGKIFDFYFIFFLLALNFFISFWQEKKADNAIQKLQEKLSVSVKVKRDGEWEKINAIYLVPGDLIEINVGDIIPADAKVLSTNNLSINEASLTGESFAVDKKTGDNLFSGSFVVTGQGEAKVTATGKNTFFNKTLLSVEVGTKKSLLEKDILMIAKFLSFLSILAIIILSITFLLEGINFLDIITLDLSLAIAGIPISLPTVITLIMSLGIMSLTKKGAIVRRLSSLEDLANVDILYTDKTGTLTRNEINVQKNISFAILENDLFFYAFLTEIKNEDQPISQAIIKKAQKFGATKREYEIFEFIPADSERKRSTVFVRTEKKELTISSGAPQVIAGLCEMTQKEKAEFEKIVDEAAKQGYRSIAIAIKEAKKVDEHKMKLVGVLFLSDTLHRDAKSVVSFLKKNGVEVRMVTGDHKSIAQRIGIELELKADHIYAEILPQDKYKLVKESMLTHVVAVTGDGVNDLPAVKMADVGMAVSNAVDALKSAADIVLTSSRIAIIKNTIIDARKIFARVYSYSVYRISESFRVIITIAVLGLIYHEYPLTPIQLILLALLNDIPIISLAFNRVKVATKPDKIKVKERFILSSLFGFVGVVNSLLLFFIMNNYLHLSWEIIQTIFFLKLAVSGHLLIFVAHTKERWYKFLPSKEVIGATIITQLIATSLAFFGIFVSRISVGWIIFVWIWAIFWMQVGEIAKIISDKILIKLKK